MSLTNTQAPVLVVTNFTEQYDLYLDGHKPPGPINRKMPEPPEGGYALYRSAARPHVDPNPLTVGRRPTPSTFLGPPRPQQFEIAKLLGMRTVVHGTAQELWKQVLEGWLTPDTVVVVYDHLQAHGGGGGKRLCLLRDIHEQQPDAFCSVYERDLAGEAIRKVQLGTKTWQWYVTGSPGEWACSRADNVGKPDESPWVLPGQEAIAPVWGFDMVFNGKDHIVCDVNFAPSIRGLGLHEVYDYGEVAKDIRAWFDKYKRSPDWCTNWEAELELLKAKVTS